MGTGKKKKNVTGASTSMGAVYRQCGACLGPERIQNLVDGLVLSNKIILRPWAGGRGKAELSGSGTFMWRKKRTGPHSGIGPRKPEDQGSSRAFPFQARRDVNSLF